MKEMGAALVKAQFLSLASEVQRKREPILVTKNGKPTVKIVPATDEDDVLAAFRFGGLKIVGDIEAPAADLEDWKALR